MTKAIWEEEEGWATDDDELAREIEAEVSQRVEGARLILWSKGATESEVAETLYRAGRSLSDPIEYVRSRLAG